jgi:hypothetical protein
MRFLVRLANESKHTPKDVRALSSLSYQAVKEFHGDVGNVRVSSAAVELDLLLESKDNLEAATSALERTLGHLLTVRELDIPVAEMGTGEAIRQGIELFNEERYWESHEALELAWRRESGREKEILQGIILLAAALVHLQKNEVDVALSVMKRTHDKLIDSVRECFGMDIGSLRDQVSSMLAVGRPDLLKLEVKR